MNMFVLIKINDMSNSSTRDKLNQVIDEIIHLGDARAIQNTDILFDDMQQRLRAVLDEIAQMPEEDRKSYNDTLGEFKKQLEQKYAVTKEKLEQTKQEFATAQNRTKAFKAYAKTTS
jgi:hypothetical protein